MGAYVYAVRAAKKSLPYLDRKVEVRLAKYVTRRSMATQPQVSIAIERAERHYEDAGAAPYIVLGDNLKDLYGSVVYRYGSDYGTFTDDYDLGTNFKAVGVILGKSRKWYIETDKRIIENLHRQHDYKEMKNGTRWIGRFGNDYNAYEEHLHSLDKKEQASTNDPNAIFFRGYHIS